MDKKKSFKIFSGNSNPLLTKGICKNLGLYRPGDIKVDRFSDGEIRVEINESVRGLDTFVLQSTCCPVNDNLLELLLIVDALKRSFAKSITAVVPYYGYARQDGKIFSRTPITAKLVANLLVASGVNRIITMDLHSGQTRGFFDIPVDNLSFTPLIYEYIKSNFDNKETVIVSPDAGSFDRANILANRFGCDMAFINKCRYVPNEASAISVVGNVRDKTVIIQDDMVDTAGTLVESIRILDRFKINSVHVFCTHPVLSGSSINRIIDSSITSLIVSDTIPLSDEAINSGKIRVLSIVDLLSRSIIRNFTEGIC